MSSLHPHWRSNDNDSQPDVAEITVSSDESDVPVRVLISDEEPMQDTPQSRAVPASRRAAAVSGILLVIGLGSSLFLKDIPEFLGQVVNTNVVRITADGFIPQEVRIEAGSDIEWINDQDIPHILSSDELCSPVEGCMETQAIFPGEKGTFTVPADAFSGIYEYGSLSAALMYGKIYVEGTDSPALADAPALTDTPLEQDEEEIIEEAPEIQPQEEEQTPSLEEDVQVEDEAPTAVESVIQENSGSDAQTSTGIFDVEDGDNHNAAPVPTGSMQNIPVNPYALGSNRVHPFDTTGRPIAQVIGQQEETMHAGAPEYHQPIRQPETGMGGLWGILLGSLMLLFVLTRKLLQAHRI